MAKIELKGTINGVTPIVEIGENKTLKQSIILFIPAYRDEFGDVKGKDEYWQLDVLGKENIDKMGFNETFVGMRGSFKVYLNSRLVPTKDSKGKPDGGEMYIINAILANTEFKS